MGSTGEIPIEQGLRQDLMTLGKAQIVTHVTASTGLDTQALGVMGFDVALAAIVVSVRGAAYLWVFSLWLLAISAAFAIQTLLFTSNPGAGPSIRDTLDLRPASEDEEIRDAILDAVATAAHQNITVLANKAKPIGSAMAFLFMAIVAAALGRI